MRKITVVLLAVLFTITLYATHNRAGEITYQQIGPLTIRMTVTTYTKESSTSADRDSLKVFWGDGLSQWVRRSNGEGQSLENDVKLNLYTAEHTYPGRSSYTLSFLDPNRSGNIVNINFPKSDDVEFFLSTRFTLLDIQFQGPNSSAQLLQPPIDIACVGQPFIHNPNAYDPDGDSLSYELIVPLSAENQEVPNYFFPDQILPGPNNLISLDPRTGNFIWQNPPQIGEYNIAMRINEWRAGVLINSIVRDMQILVKNCNNKPPQIEVLEEICVIAGTEINLKVKVNDTDINQKVKISVTGGPFALTEDRAELVAPEGFTNVPFDAALVWKTTCNHVSKQYYQVVLRAIDNAFGDTFGLATLKTIRIKVVAPPPENLVTSVEGTSGIRLDWKFPYTCQDTKNDYFYGFSIWRREQSKDLLSDTCNPESVRNHYTRIVFNTKNNDGNTYNYVDNSLKSNTTYCYRVVAEFALKTASGNPFNKAESIASNESCIQLRRDIPVFTKVSVDKTDILNGAISLRWTKPLLSDFDTTKLQGPYRTELYRSEAGQNNFIKIPEANKASSFFGSWKDTTYTDIGINTAEKGFDYLLKFYVNNDIPYGEVPQAGSVFLMLSPTDRKMKLHFSYQTPWSNKNFFIYRKNDGGIFEVIGSTDKNDFVDSGLENGKEYCYKVEAFGTYSISNIEDPIVNWSQEQCHIPLDNIAPCPPSISIATICDDEEILTENAENELMWKNNYDCGNVEDITAYNIYFIKDSGASPVVLETVLGNAPYLFRHSPGVNDISGCYFITSLDKANNESARSNEICIENCPVYELPNTFTPNGDSHNDVFRPSRNFFIQRVDFKLFNEWGNAIFSTNDPKINWDGRSIDGKEVSAGTYYYICNVIVKSTTGVVTTSSLKGYINIIR